MRPKAIATIHRALELGVNLLDTADLYGPLLNERLVAKAIAGRRESTLLATKFGFEVDDNEQLTWRLNGRPEYVRKAIERSLRNLGTDYMDLYYLHRLDPNTPIEDTVGAMSRFVEEGKVRYLGLSEVSADIMRRAHRRAPHHGPANRVFALRPGRGRGRQSAGHARHGHRLRGLFAAGPGLFVGRDQKP